VLFAHAKSMPQVRILNRTQLTGFEQHDTGITATAADLDGGEDLTIAAGYMIGTDGPHSIVRRRIGATPTGDPMLEQRQSPYIRAPDLLRATPTKPARANTSLNPRRSANMFAIDGRETWLVHNYMRPGETFDGVDRDGCIRTIQGVGPSFPTEVLAKEDWTARRMIADRLNFGSFIENSPVIAHDGGAPGYTIYEFTPSTVPGCRTPHIWLEEGVSLYDATGPDFTLLHFDPRLDVANLLTAAESRCMPLTLLDVSITELVYAEKLILSGPDQHLAWRGNTVPAVRCH